MHTDLIPAVHVGGNPAEILALSGDRYRWQDDAACRGTDVEAFYPRKSESVGTYPRRLCQGCPVRSECLEFGLYEVHGIWGGLGPMQRAEEAKRRQAAGREATDG